MTEQEERPLGISRSGFMNLMKLSFRTSLSSITDEKLSLLRSIFAECDRDGSGSIDHDEMREMLFKLGLENTEKTVEELFKKMDSTQAGSVNFFEFMKGMPTEMLNQIDVRMIKGLAGSKSRDKYKTAKRVYDQDQIKAVRKLFSKYDKDGSGAIDPDEFVVMMQEIAPRLTNEEIEGIMKSMDSDGDGTINFMEFLNGAPEWVLSTVLSNSPKPNRAPVPVFLFGNRKLRTTDDNFKTIIHCFENTDTDVDGVVSPAEVSEALVKVITKIFGKDKVESVKKFFDDPNLQKVTFKEFAVYLDMAFELTDFQKFEIKKSERMLAKKIATGKTPKKEPPKIAEMKKASLSQSLNFVPSEAKTIPKVEEPTPKFISHDYTNYQKGGILSRLLGQKTLTLNTTSVTAEVSQKPPSPIKPIPIPLPSQVVDVGTSMTPPGSPQSGRRGVRYISVGDEEIDRKSPKTDSMRRSKSYNAMDTMTEPIEEEAPLPEAADDILRQVDEYRSQIDALQGQIGLLLKMLKSQKQEQDFSKRQSVSLLKSKLESLAGEMEELERENIRALTSSVSSNTESVVEAVNKAMLAARLNHRVKNLENRNKENENRIAHLVERKTYYKNLVKPVQDENADLQAKIELLEDKIRAKDAKIHAMIDNRVELEDERDRKDNLIESLSKSELSLMEKLDQFTTKLIELGVDPAELR